MVPVKKAVVVVAHPRSGTHVTLDFIRRNFPAFNPALFVWQSARELYVSLDEPEWREHLLRQANRSDHVLMQSHLVGVQSLAGSAAIDYLHPDDAIFIYPFRRFSATMRSFAAFSQYPGSVRSFLHEPSAFYPAGRTVEDWALIHGEQWMKREPVFLDVEAMIAEPERAARKLGEVLGMEPAPLARRLPHRRVFYGKMAEAVERLRGRESTEVKVAFEKQWTDPDEAASIDEAFSDLHADLSARSLI
jgi:hypothetical protein